MPKGARRERLISRWESEDASRCLAGIDSASTEAPAQPGRPQGSIVPVLDNLLLVALSKLTRRGLGKEAVKVWQPDEEEV